MFSFITKMIIVLFSRVNFSHWSRFQNLRTSLMSNFAGYAVKYAAASSGAALGEVTRGDGRLFSRCGSTTSL